MSVLRFLTLILLFTTLLGACGRSDLIRIRLLAPVSEAKKDHSILTDTQESSTPTYTNTSSGGSIYFLLKSIGLGYTTVTTNFEKTGTNLIEKTTLVTNFADLAFGIGENYSFMWGAGVLSGGKQKTELKYGSNSIWELGNVNVLTGHSLFFTLGHHGSGFETLLGYRMNFIKSKFDDSGTKIPTEYMGMSPTDEYVSYESTRISLTTSQVQLGIGVTF